MGPFRVREIEFAHIATMVGMLEKIPPVEAASNGNVVMHPLYWLERLDALIALGPLPPTEAQLARALRNRLERLVQRCADPPRPPVPSPASALPMPRRRRRRASAQPRRTIPDAADAPDAVD